MIYLLAYNTGSTPDAPDFAFDAEINEEMTLDYKWTQYPIEDGAEVSDFGYKLPEKFKVAGAVTESPLIVVSPYIDESQGQATGKRRVMDAIAALKKVSDAKQPMSLVARYWSPADIVIDSVNASLSDGDGYAPRIEIAVHQVQLPKAKTVDIPASRYKAKVKRKAPGQKGGAAATKNKAPTAKKGVPDLVGLAGLRKFR
jgi:hypothetical protein